MLAAADGHHDAVVLVLARGADPNVRDENGDGLLRRVTPWPKCLEVVLPLRLPVDQANRKGRTPFNVRLSCWRIRERL